jgi:hypothetical protein
LGELSQQPTWPQVRQRRRCTHDDPLFRHSSQPAVRAVTASIVVTCEQDMSHLTSIKSAEKLSFIDRNPRIHRKQMVPPLLRQ